MNEYQADLARGHGNIGILLSDTGHPEAMASYEKALAIWERLARDFPTVTEYRENLSHCHHVVAILLQNTGRLAEALESYRRDLVLVEQLVRDHPTVPEYHSMLAQSRLDTGATLWTLGGRPAEAVALWQQCAGGAGTARPRPPHRYQLSAHTRRHA